MEKLQKQHYDIVIIDQIKSWLQWTRNRSPIEIGFVAFVSFFTITDLGWTTLVLVLCCILTGMFFLSEKDDNKLVDFFNSNNSKTIRNDTFQTCVNNSSALKQQKTTSQDDSSMINNQKPEEYHKQGLENFGNICFINSVIQCLRATPTSTSVSLIQALENEDNLRLSHPFADTLVAFVKLAMALQFENDLVSDRHLEFLAACRISMKSIVSKPNWQEQQDAEEFLSLLLTGFHEALCSSESLEPASVTAAVEGIINTGHNTKQAVTALKQHQSNKSSIISQTFEGCVVRGSVCSICSYLSILQEPFRTLSLEIKWNKESEFLETKSVQDCVAHFGTSESFVGANSRFCSQCNTNRDGESQVLLQSPPPPVLVVHLKRFEVVRNKAKKVLSVEISNSVTLNLTSLMFNREFEVCYDLYGVVCHIGDTLYSGHYISYVKSDNGWYKYDDNNVYDCDTEDIWSQEYSTLSTGAYILCYKKSLNYES